MVASPDSFHVHRSSRSHPVAWHLSALCGGREGRGRAHARRRSRALVRSAYEGDGTMIVERKRFGSRGQGALIRFDTSANWYTRYSVRGKEHVESTGTSDYKKAVRFHRQKLDEIAADRQGL